MIILRSCLVAALLSCTLKAAPKMKMHRLQATTADASGWYLAAANKGNFSVLIPLPFNDFSVTDHDPKAGSVTTHTVGAKSSEGIKFSATQSPIVEGRSITDPAALPKQFEKPGQTVADIDSAAYAGHPSVAFSVKGPATGAYVRCVKTTESVILLILEFPNVHAKAAEEFKNTFLSSLEITPPPEAAASVPP